MNLEQPGQILNRFHVDLHPDIASKGWQYSQYIHVCAERAHSEDKLAGLVLEVYAVQQLQHIAGPGLKIVSEYQPYLLSYWAAKSLW